MAVADALPVYHHRERHSLHVDATPEAALVAASRRGSRTFRSCGRSSGSAGCEPRDVDRSGTRCSPKASSFTMRRRSSSSAAPGRRAAASARRTTSPPSTSRATRRWRWISAPSPTVAARGSRRRRASSSPMPRSRRRFLAYWLVIRPFSGLITAALAARGQTSRRARSARTFLGVFRVFLKHGHESSQCSPCRRRPHIRRALPRAPRRRLSRCAARARERGRRRGRDAGGVRRRLPGRAARHAAAVASRLAARDLGERAQTPLSDIAAPPARAAADADFPLTADLPHEQSRALAEALAALPPEQRRVFVFREIVGLSYDEIAARSTRPSPRSRCCSSALAGRCERSRSTRRVPPQPVSLLPLPGWLAGLVSRFEVATLTPRVVGALGATVLTVAGASVAVPRRRPRTCDRRRGPQSRAAGSPRRPPGRARVAPKGAPTRSASPRLRTTVRVQKTTATMPKPTGTAAATPSSRPRSCRRRRVS